MRPMIQKSLIIAAAILASPILPMSALAGEGAHVHGEAQIAVSVEVGGVTIALNSAMYNITGFERAPKTSQEMAVLDSAIAKLSSGVELFALNEAAGCVMESASHSLPIAAADVETGANPYRDLEASYMYACAAPDQLGELTVNLFDHFEKLEAVQAIVFDDDRQIAQELVADNNRLRWSD